MIFLVSTPLLTTVKWLFMTNRALLLLPQPLVLEELELEQVLALPLPIYMEIAQWSIRVIQSYEKNENSNVTLSMPLKLR